MAKKKISNKKTADDKLSIEELEEKITSNFKEFLEKGFSEGVIQEMLFNILMKNDPEKYTEKNLSKCLNNAKSELQIQKTENIPSDNVTPNGDFIAKCNASLELLKYYLSLPEIYINEFMIAENLYPEVDKLGINKYPAKKIIDGYLECGTGVNGFRTELAYVSLEEIYDRIYSEIIKYYNDIGKPLNREIENIKSLLVVKTSKFDHKALKERINNLYDTIDLIRLEAQNSNIDTDNFRESDVLRKMEEFDKKLAKGERVSVKPENQLEWNAAIIHSKKRQQNVMKSNTGTIKKLLELGYTDKEIKKELLPDNKNLDVFMCCLKEAKKEIGLVWPHETSPGTCYNRLVFERSMEWVRSVVRKRK